MLLSKVQAKEVELSDSLSDKPEQAGLDTDRAADFFAAGVSVLDEVAKNWNIYHSSQMDCGFRTRRRQQTYRRSCRLSCAGGVDSSSSSSSSAATRNHAAVRWSTDWSACALWLEGGR
jgi:hypothetical protein